MKCDFFLVKKNFDRWVTYSRFMILYEVEPSSSFLQNSSILTFSTKVIWIGHNVLKQVLNLNFLSSGALA